jgi:predicted extracellular nuclease
MWRMRTPASALLPCPVLLAVLVLMRSAWAHEPMTAAPQDAAVAVHAIQGQGARSPWAGRRVVTEGAVTLVTSNGFFLQELDGEADSRGSRAIFVFTGSPPATVAAGQCVRLGGRVVEFNAGAADNRETLAHPVTELHDAATPQLLRDGCAVAPVALTLPLAGHDSLERFEGMLVTLRGPLTVQQNFFLGRFGQLTLAAGGRVQAPTDVVRPGAAAQVLARANARRAIVLDDGSALQFPSPVPWLADDGTVRAGDTVAEITGVIDYGLASARTQGPGTWKIHPVRPVAFVRANPRQTSPPAVGGDLRVAAANVDNFFTTLADGRNVCAPRFVAADCRGARSVQEFERQRAKLVEMLAAVDADVVALMEVENNGATALRSLVDALNARAGAPAWALIDEPAGGSGTDAIRVALIYKPARVVPVGPARSDRDPVHNRPPLAQLFETRDGGARFNVIANHFKSRRCDGATGSDLDQGDLQGCFNHQRVAQARALARFADGIARASGTADTLLVGDFNAYAREDPPERLVAAGFADQVARFDPDGYSYVFDGAAGRLDGVFANAPMAARVTGVTEWHVDADEPGLLDYAFALRGPAGSRAGPNAPAWTPTPWRASDHDPVVIGLRFGVGAGSARSSGLECLELEERGATHRQAATMPPCKSAPTSRSPPWSPSRPSR